MFPKIGCFPLNLMSSLEIRWFSTIFSTFFWSKKLRTVIRVQNHWNTILFRHGARVVCSSHRAGDGSVELGVVLVEVVRGHGGKTPGNQVLLDVFFISVFCLYVILLFFLLAYIYIYVCVCHIYIYNYI